ncbi:MAG: LysR family transcriptional regulator [Thermosynechococcaceae cyanobacterium MS004]|nr:LysR family transcriptional regulator [Thermosynechococcaceae cyanobacterium MS004]
MRIEQLQAFLAVVQTGSFQRAAAQCGVTQSTISRQIQGLEEGVGMPLFHRGGQNKLTVAGDRLLPKARRIFTEWQDALTSITALKDGQQTELCVAAIQSVCAHYLPPVLQKFCQLYPQIQLRVTSLGSDRSLKVLRDGLVDLAIIMDNPTLIHPPETVVDPLYDEPIQVLMAANHPLAQEAVVPWYALAQFPHVVFKDGYGMQRLVQEQFKQLGLELNIAMELNTLDAFRGVIRQGNMVALLPQGALVESRRDPSLAVRDLAVASQDVQIGQPQREQSQREPSQREQPQPCAAVLMRKVVMITTTDRLLIPPIANFRQLVQQSMGSIQVPSTLPQSILPQPVEYV